MGCVASKNVAPGTPVFYSSGASGSLDGSGASLACSLWNRVDVDRSESGESGKVSSTGTNSQTFGLGNLCKYIEGEQVACGWPAWLVAAAKEAIQGWVPLKADGFEKLEKIGQGTYSSVFKARDLATGKIVALKKVRFDNFEPESVKFMAREIVILRRLNHPNVIKLEGLITSWMSCSIYLVFEYMEHDLAGMISSPEIKFSESQVKCYMHQLLSGLEHCHSHGIMHRDIKCANLLVNNDGILKLADFGLANFSNQARKQPLTSRVVTLWYRPPELLLGSTDYEGTVDLWSVGCVFAELFLGKPILQGRTEVEQMHKIFKLCGSPPDDYWTRSRLPHAMLFKPQQPYENCLRRTLQFLPDSAFGLLETCLSLESHKRGSASSALQSEYFRTKPYACEPSSLPRYSPAKEIEAKSREEQRRRVASRGRGSEAMRPSRTCRARQPIAPTKPAARLEELWISKYGVEENGAKQDFPRVNGENRLFVDLQPMAAINLPDDAQHLKKISQGGFSLSGQSASVSTGLTRTRKQKEDHPSIISHSRSSSKCDTSDGLDPLSVLRYKNSSEFKGKENEDLEHETRSESKSLKPYEKAKQVMLKQWMQFEHQDSFNTTDVYQHKDFGRALCRRDIISSKHLDSGYHDRGDRVEFSGPLLSQSDKVDELLEQHEHHIRHAARRSWFQKGRKQEL